MQTSSASMESSSLRTLASQPFYRRKATMPLSSAATSLGPFRAEMDLFNKTGAQATQKLMPVTSQEDQQSAGLSNLKIGTS